MNPKILINMQPNYKKKRNSSNTFSNSIFIISLSEIDVGLLENVLLVFLEREITSYHVFGEKSSNSC